MIATRQRARLCPVAGPGFGSGRFLPVGLIPGFKPDLFAGPGLAFFDFEGSFDLRVELMPKELTYPEAAQRAASEPRMRPNPAVPLFEVIDSIGPAKVSAAGSGPIEVTTSVIDLVVDSGSPTRPRIETSAIRAGKGASRL